jgi:hypothetical protein
MVRDVLVLMILALMSAPVGPIVFFGAGVAGFALRSRSYTKHVERVRIRRGAFIWAGVWAVLFLLIATLYLVDAAG